jgi:hypothetical protein
MGLGSEPIVSWGLPPGATAAIVAFVVVLTLLLLSYLLGLIGSAVARRWRSR